MNKFYSIYDACIQILDYVSEDIREIKCPFIISTNKQSIHVQCECSHTREKGIWLFDCFNLTMNK